MKAVDFLEQAQSKLEITINESLTAYNGALKEIANMFETVEVSINDVITPDEVVAKLYTLIESVEPKKIKKTVIKEDEEVVKTKYLFKKPSTPKSITDQIANKKMLLDNAIKIEREQTEIKNKLSKQRAAILSETKKALKAVLYPTKITNITEALNFILDWTNNIKNHTEQKNVLLYQSQDAEGNFKGGNGKSFITSKILDACNEIGFPSIPANIPDYYTSEITDVFANNIICLAEEQHLRVPQNPAYPIIDNNYYTTKIKYEKSMNIKSITNFIGTTNESLVNAEQTFVRRIKLIKCAEDFNAQEYAKSHNGVLPNGDEVKNAWVYLLTHDLTNVKIDNSNTRHKQANAISTSELNILYKLVEAVDIVKNGKETIYSVKEIKDYMTNADKITLVKVYDVLLKYGATHYANGKHGKRIDGYTQIDISNLNIPTEIFDGVEHNPEDVFAAIDELVFIEPTDPTGTDDFDILDDFMSKIQKGEEEKEEPKEEVELFNYIEEPKESYSDAFQVYPTNNVTDQFETINRCFGLTEIDKVVGITEPHTLTRKDDNVFSMRNFCFEIDDLSLQEQIDLIKENKDVINRAVFSGNKSIHCRITINYNPKSKEEYKFIFKYLNEKYFKGVVDTSCSNPSRLTRRPNGVRSDSKKIQKLLFKNNNVIDVEFLHQQFLEEQKVKKVMAKTKPDTRYERKCDDIIEELESLSDEVKGNRLWQKAYAIATNDGTAEYQDVWAVISYYKFLGYSSEEIAEQIDFGKWNISVKTIENIYE